MTDPLDQRLTASILSAIGAHRIERVEPIQELWSGYGAILRIRPDIGNPVVAKLVRFPDGARHPRGWNTGNSHRRKVRSYEVESSWYREWSHLLDDTCRIPGLIAFESHDDRTLLLMEDLDHAGFPHRTRRPDDVGLEACLSWLAAFHARFLGTPPEGLWQQGTYWHLETRSDELEALDDLPLKRAASAIDAKLRNATHRTIVHGDAKLANFCFSADGSRVAAVDFQYVGGGCGMKDLAYFIGSCFDEDECRDREEEILRSYFGFLRKFMIRQRPQIDPSAVESEWRELFPYAWTDFHRFLKGWSPGHRKINGYSESIARGIVAEIESR